MLRLPQFEFVRPESVAETVALLDRHGEQCKVVAGGTGRDAWCCRLHRFCLAIGNLTFSAQVGEPPREKLEHLHPARFGDGIARSKYTSQFPLRPSRCDIGQHFRNRFSYVFTYADTVDRGEALIDLNVA